MLPEGAWRSGLARFGAPMAAIALGLLCGRGAALAGIAALAPALALCAARARGVPPTLPWAVAVGAAVGTATVGPLRTAAAVGVCGCVALWAARRPATLASSAGLVALLAALLSLAAHPAAPWTAPAAIAAQAGLGAAAGAAAATPAGGWVLAAAAAAAGVAGLPGGALLAGGALAAAAVLIPAAPADGAVAIGVAGAVAGLALGAPGFAAASGALAGAAAGLLRGRSAWLRGAATAGGGALAAPLVLPTPWGWALGALAGAGVGALVAAAGERGPAAVPLAPTRAAPPPVGAPDAGAGSNGGRPSLAARVRAAAAACIELGRGLAEAPALGAALDGDLGLRVAEQVCPGCPALSACWERKYPRARRMVGELWEAASAGPVSWRQVGGPETIFCLRPREMAEAANRHAELRRQRREFLDLLASSRRAAVAPLVAIGRELHALADEAAAAVEPPWSPPAAEAPVLQRWGAAPAPDRMGYECAAAHVARPGRAVSGDTARCRLLRGERLALVLSDGMGSGEAAAVTSTGAVEHLLAALAAGRSAADALRQTNEQMLADGGPERFATVDLAIVQLRGGAVEWHKMGAAAAFLAHARGVRELAGGGLPAGILAAPEIRSGRTRLRPGDALILVSDGVLDRPAGLLPAQARAGRARWAAEWLRQHGLGGVSAAGGARALLSAARDRSAIAEHDDLTVLVCRMLAPRAAGTPGAAGAAGGGGSADATGEPAGAGIAGGR